MSHLVQVVGNALRQIRLTLLGTGAGTWMMALLWLAFAIALYPKMIYPYQFTNNTTLTGNVALASALGLALLHYDWRRYGVLRNRVLVMILVMTVLLAAALALTGFNLDVLPALLIMGLLAISSTGYPQRERWLGWVFAFLVGWLIASIIGSVVGLLIFAFVPDIAGDTGWRSFLNKTCHELFGVGRQAWVMALLGLVLLPLVFQYLLLPVIIENPWATTIYGGLLGITVGLSILHSGLQGRSVPSRRTLVIAIGSAILLAIIIPPAANVLVKWTTLFGADLPAAVEAANRGILHGLASVLMAIIIITRRLGFGRTWRILLVSVTGGLLLSLALTYPIYTGVYTLYVPSITYAGAAHEQATIATFLLAAVIALLIAPVSVLVVRPDTVRQRLGVGALSGLIASFVLYLTIGAGAGGIIAQSGLYGVAISRVGYNEAEWLFKLAVAVNDTFFVTYGTFLLLASAGLLIGVITGMLVPARSVRKVVESNTPQWVYTTLIASPLIFINFMLIAVILALLGPAVRNIYTTFGFTPEWDPLWNVPLLAAPAWVLMNALQLAVIVWLHRTYVRSQRPGTKALLNAVVVNGILMFAASIFSTVINPSPLNFAAMIWTGGWSLELARLGIIIPRGEQSVSNRRDWVAAGIWAIGLMMLSTYHLIVISLSMVLIAVVAIVELAATTQAVPGLAWLTDFLDTAFSFGAQSQSVVLIPFATTGIIIALFLAYDVPGAFTRWVVRQLPSNNRNARFTRVTQHSLIRPVAGIVKRALAFPPITFALALLLDLGVLHAPILTAVWSVFVLSQSLLRRVPAALVVIPLAGLGLSLPLLITGDATLPRGVVEIGLVLSIVTLYRVVGAYGSESFRSSLRMGLPVIAAILLGLMTAVQQPIITTEGGVSRYDGEQWTVYNRDNSTLGTVVAYDLLQDRNGVMWFAGSGGAVARYDGEQWQLKLMMGVNTNFLRENASTLQVKLAQDNHDNLWLAVAANIGTLRETRPGGLTLSLPCPYAIVDERNNHSCPVQPTISGSPIPTNISAMTTANDGSLWFTTDTAVIQVTRGYEWHVFGNADYIWAFKHDAPFVSANDLLANGDTLLAATDQGLFRYIDGNWLSVGDTHEPVQRVFVDSTGILWAGMGADLVKINADTAASVLKLAGTVTSFAESGDGNLWVGTTEGLLRYNPATSTTAFFDEANSGLATNTVYDVLVDMNGDIWVSTLERSEIRLPVAVLFLLSFGLITIIGGGIALDYGRSPVARARRKGHELAADQDNLYAQVYPLIAELPDSSVLRTIADELNKAGIPTGAASVFALADMLDTDDIPAALHKLVQALDADGLRPWARTLHAVYSVALAACTASHVNAIITLELTVNPGLTGGSTSLNARSYNVDILPPFLPQGTARFWQALTGVSANLQKYHEVDDTGDRLSYLAAALSSVETVQSIAQSVTAPDGKVLQTIASSWRVLIAEIINLLSGSAELRLDLRTRQVQRSDHVVLVLRLENTGRSAAEGIRVVLQASDDYAIVGDPSQLLERLPAGRNMQLEFALAPGDAALIRAVFTVIWDDRLDAGKSLDYADIVRFYENESEFQLIPNPYIVGHPVKSSQMFFGREDVFRFIEQNISGVSQDRTIILYGQRRTGKTSFLYQLMDGQLGERYIPVLIDMQSLTLLVESTGDFLGEIAYQIGRALIQAHLTIEVPDINADTPSPTRIFNRFLDTLADTMSDKRLLISIDEFELIEDKIRAGKLDANIMDYFRSLVQHRNQLVFIFTGTHRLEEMSQDYWSILFNIALYRQISYLTDTEAVALIRQPVRDYLTVDDLAVEKILRLTSNHPYFIQLLCWAMVNHCNEQRRNYASINDINDVLETMLTTGEAHFSYIWQQITQEQQLALAALAHTSGRTTIWAQPQEILETLQTNGDAVTLYQQVIELLDSLVTQDVVEGAAEGTLRYRFRLEVLGLWIKNNKSVSALIERRCSNPT